MALGLILIAVIILLVVLRDQGPTPEVTRYPDPALDTFDYNGNAINGEPYLDIVNTDVLKSGSNYILRMKLNGALPRKTAQSDTFIEWDFMLDTDLNPNTGTFWPLISNDLGYDYLARVTLEDRSWGNEVLTTNNGKFDKISYRAIDNVIEVTIPQDIIGKPDTFNWTAAVREYKKGDKADSPSVSDKSPNSGQLSFPVVSPPEPAPSALNQDPEGDIFDKSGNPLKGDDYLDITGAGVTASGGRYLVTITLKGNLPQKTPAMGTFIEWDFMIDSDKNSATGNVWPLITNDLGVEYMARVTLTDNKWNSEVFSITSPNNKKRIYFTLKDNTIEMVVPASEIGKSTSFNWTVDVREYKANDPPASPSFSDKNPDKDHYTYP